MSSTGMWTCHTVPLEWFWLCQLSLILFFDFTFAHNRGTRRTCSTSFHWSKRKVPGDQLDATHPQQRSHHQLHCSVSTQRLSSIPNLSLAAGGSYKLMVVLETAAHSCGSIPWQNALHFRVIWWSKSVQYGDKSVSQNTMACIGCTTKISNAYRLPPYVPWCMIYNDRVVIHGAVATGKDPTSREMTSSLVRSTRIVEVQIKIEKKKCICLGKIN